MSAAYAQALKKLGAAGLVLKDTALPELDTINRVNGNGGIAPPEAFSIHRDNLKNHGAEVDPNVRARIERAAPMTAADYIANVRARVAAIARADEALSDFDILVMPTTPIVAPKMSEIATAEGFGKLNPLVLRNPSTVNFLDLCAVSLPMKLGNALPCGLMLVARHNHDAKLLQIAAADRAVAGGLDRATPSASRPVDAAFDAVALDHGADAGGRSGHDDVAGADRNLLRQLRDDLRHIPDHLREIGVLLHRAVDESQMRPFDG